MGTMTIVRCSQCGRQMEGTGVNDGWQVEKHQQDDGVDCVGDYFVDHQPVEQPDWA